MKVGLSSSDCSGEVLLGGGDVQLLGLPPVGEIADEDEEDDDKVVLVKDLGGAFRES
jgi:hypothetical protein